MFKVGDRVRINELYQDKGFIGKTGTILTILDSTRAWPYRVEFPGFTTTIRFSESELEHAPAVERLIWCDADHCKCGAPKLKDWCMFDVPVTFSVKAPSAAAAEAYVREALDTQLDLYTDGEAYERDHAFVDGQAHKCDCVGH